MNLRLHVQHHANDCESEWVNEIGVFMTVVNFQSLNFSINKAGKLDFAFLKYDYWIFAIQFKLLSCRTMRATLLRITFGSQVALSPYLNFAHLETEITLQYIESWSAIQKFNIYSSTTVKSVGKVGRLLKNLLIGSKFIIICLDSVFWLLNEINLNGHWIAAKMDSMFQLSQTLEESFYGWVSTIEINKQSFLSLNGLKPFKGFKSSLAFYERLARSLTCNLKTRTVKSVHLLMRLIQFPCLIIQIYSRFPAEIVHALFLMC